MEKGLQTTFSIILGAILLLVGVVGFFDELIFGLFSVNALHNLVHILSGAVPLWAGLWGGTKISRLWLKIFGIIYLLTAILGFLGLGTFLAVNTADNWLHVVLGVVIAGVGFFAPD
jgi:hypothetical protein